MWNKESHIAIVCASGFLFVCLAGWLCFRFYSSAVRPKSTTVPALLEDFLNNSSSS